VHCVRTTLTASYAGWDAYQSEIYPMHDGTPGWEVVEAGTTGPGPPYIVSTFGLPPEAVLWWPMGRTEQTIVWWRVAYGGYAAAILPYRAVDCVAPSYRLWMPVGG
jgi:hypothetical protein